MVYDDGINADASRRGSHLHLGHCRARQRRAQGAPAPQLQAPLPFRGEQLVSGHFEMLPQHLQVQVAKEKQRRLEATRRWPGGGVPSGPLPGPMSSHLRLGLMLLSAPLLPWPPLPRAPAQPGEAGVAQAGGPVQLEAQAEDLARGDLGEEGPVLAQRRLALRQLRALQHGQDVLALGLALQAPHVQEGRQVPLPAGERQPVTGGLHPKAERGGKAAAGAEASSEP